MIINFPHYRDIIQAAFCPGHQRFSRWWARRDDPAPAGTHVGTETTFAADRENGPGGLGRIGNAVISERVKKCGRIKAPFASRGPPWRRPTQLNISDCGNDGGGGRARNWFCIFMKAFLTARARVPHPRPRSSSPSAASADCVAFVSRTRESISPG